jgi:hypothetical protein
MGAASGASAAAQQQHQPGVRLLSPPCTGNLLHSALFCAALHVHTLFDLCAFMHAARNAHILDSFYTGSSTQRAQPGCPHAQAAQRLHLLGCGRGGAKWRQARGHPAQCFPRGGCISPLHSILTTRPTQTFTARPTQTQAQGCASPVGRRVEPHNCCTHCICCIASLAHPQARTPTVTSPVWPTQHGAAAAAIRLPLLPLKEEGSGSGILATDSLFPAPPGVPGVPAAPAV